MIKTESKKIFMIFLCFLSLFFLSGCEFKLFEKIDESENLGEIDDNVKPVEKEEKKETNDEDYITVSKIKFEKNKEQILYCKLDTWGYTLPVDTTKNKEKQFDQGAEVKRIGLSIDGTWAMIENENSQIYIKTEMLSIDKVKTKSEIEAEEKAKQEEEERIRQEEERKKQEQNNASQPSGGNSGGNSSSGGGTTTQKPKPPVQGGIPYQGGSDSINFGVAFANSNFTAKVVAQCSANTGPGKAVPSTGYEVIQWFYAGDSVQVTGIGQNGYIRVSVGGRTGFINNTCLTR